MVPPLRPTVLPSDTWMHTFRHVGIFWPLLALTLGSFAIGTTEFVAMGLLPNIAETIGKSIPQTGHVISAYAIGVVVGAPLFAALGVTLPRRVMLIGLMTLFTVGNLLTAMASSYSTLLAARFLAGLPHGAFFGIAALVATNLAGAERRAWAVARVLLGLMLANVIGVPVATALGQHLGWRSAFVLVALIGVATILALRSWVAEQAPPAGANLRTELRVLRRPQVWLTLGVGAIGFGGMFAVYSYITPTLTSLAGMRATTVPLVLAVWGLGMVVGNVVGGWLADRGVVRAMLVTLTTTAAFLALFSITSRYAMAATATAFLLGTTVAMGPALQVRLMDVAADAQTITAALVHAAFNAANALGPWLGGLALAAGFGWTAPAWVGVALAMGGIVMLGGSVLVERYESTRRVRAAAALPASYEPLSECA